MPTRSRKRNLDLNHLAMLVVASSTGEAPAETKPVEPKKSPAAVALGRLGGRKGGKTRAAKLTNSRCQEVDR